MGALSVHTDDPLDSYVYAELPPFHTRTYDLHIARFPSVIGDSELTNANNAAELVRLAAGFRAHGVDIRSAKSIDREKLPLCNDTQGFGVLGALTRYFSS